VGLPASEAPLFLLGERYDFAPPPGAHDDEAAAAAVAQEARANTHTHTHTRFRVLVSLPLRTH
jgi:hypothetical protein